MLKRIIFLGFFVVVSVFANPVNKDIAKNIKQEFKTDFGVWDLKFNKDTLVLRFANTNMLYSKGSSHISRSFKLILKDFMPRYVAILKPYESDIKKVAIDGFTSSENSHGKTKDEKYKKNLLLSQKRADGVLAFIKTLDNKVLQENKAFIDKKFVAIGKSSSHLIFKTNGEEDKIKSRRIEIAIQFFDDTLLEKSIATSKSEGKTLYDYVKRLLKENPTLKKQLAILKSTKEDIKTSKAAFRPKLDLNYSFKDYGDYDDGTSAKKTQDQSRDITLQYNLFNGFKDMEQLAITKANYISTGYVKDQVEEELIYSLVDAYITAQKITDMFALSRENYMSYMDWVGKEKIRFQNGLTSLKDFKKIQARSIDRFMNFEEDTKRYNDSITTLQRYLNFDDREMKLFKSENPQNKYFGNVVLGLQDVAKYSPYIQEAQSNVNLYQQKMLKAKVHFYPTVNLIGKNSVLDEKYTSPTPDATTKEASITVEAKINLYAGGADKANYQKKFYQYQQKVAKRDEVIRDTKYKLDLVYNKYFMLDSKKNFIGDLVKTREEEYVAANYDYKFAKIDANRLLDVKDSVYQAKRKFIETKYDFILVKYEILKNLGLLKAYILGEI